MPSSGSARRIARTRLASSVLALALGLFAAAGEADATGLNVEQLRLRPEDDGLHGGVQLGLTFQGGNTNRFDLSTSASLAYRRDRHLAFLVGDSQFSTRTRALDGDDLSTLFAPESRFVNKSTVHLRYNYEVLDWLVPEVFVQLEHNEFLLVESRVLFGVGPRFVPYNNGEFSLAIGTDYMLEYEALDAAQVVRPLPARTLVHRFSSYLSLVYAADDRLRMSSTTYVQPRFDLFADLRLLSEAMLDVLLIEPVSIRLLLRLRYDSRPSTFCSSDVGVRGCPTADQHQLRKVDVAVENSISVRF